jgi:hypothetical protein
MALEFCSGLNLYRLKEGIVSVVMILVQLVYIVIVGVYVMLVSVSFVRIVVGGIFKS